ncbi:MAG: glycosyltransferase family 25 protein [Pseudomonadota bacterium]
MTGTVYTEVINLARASERRAHMQAELATAGITARFLPAFDMKEHAPEKLLEHCTRTGPWGVFQPGNMACTISHELAWERFLETGAEFCVILEDDVYISPDIAAWLADLSWWPDDAHLVKIERWNGRDTKVLLERSGPDHLGRSLRRLFSRHVGSAGYILNRDGARIMLAHRPFRVSIDNHLFNRNASPAARAVVTYQVNPALVTQGNEPEGVPASLTHRKKPEGMEKWLQKARRGWHEVAYPLSTYLKFLTGRIALARVPYAARVGAANPPLET